MLTIKVNNKSNYFQIPLKVYIKQYHISYIFFEIDFLINKEIKEEWIYKAGNGIKKMN